MPVKIRRLGERAFGWIGRLTGTGGRNISKNKEGDSFQIPMRKSICGIVVGIMLNVGQVAGAGQQSDADVVKSFKNSVAHYMSRCAAIGGSSIHESNGQWRKVFFEPSKDFSIDIRKTDSLVSPYLGILEFTLTIHFTEFRNTKAETEPDNRNNVKVSFTRKHKHTYVSQDGKWISKTSQRHIPGKGNTEDQWVDCKWTTTNTCW